jgi:uncharacterized damage-inducible protein DinB
MKKYFLKLYQYNAWANKRVIDCLSRQRVNDEKILSLLGHIFVAQLQWLNRIRNVPAPDMKLWGVYELGRLVSLSEQAAKEWLAYIESADDFNREMTYKNNAGDTFTNSLEMIMIHVINHSTYHRAQIAILLPSKDSRP